MFKRNIFIGKAKDGDTIYFDTRDNIPLKAKGTKIQLIKNPRVKYVATLLLALLFYGILRMLENFTLFTFYSMESLAILFIVSIGIFVLLSLFFHLIFYKNVKYAEPTTKENLEYAINGSTLWRNSKNKIATKGKTTPFYFSIFVIFACEIFFVYQIIDLLTNENKYYELISGYYIEMFVGAGFFLSVLYFILFINNPIRWFNVVQLYQKENGYIDDEIQ